MLSKILLLLLLGINSVVAMWPHNLLAHAGQCGAPNLPILASLLARRQAMTGMPMSMINVHLGCAGAGPVMIPAYAFHALRRWGQPFWYQEIMGHHQHHCHGRPCASPDNTLPPPLNFDNIRVGPWHLIHDAY